MKEILRGFGTIVILAHVICGCNEDAGGSAGALSASQLRKALVMQSACTGESRFYWDYAIAGVAAQTALASILLEWGWSFDEIRCVAGTNDCDSALLCVSRACQLIAHGTTLL